MFLRKRKLAEDLDELGTECIVPRQRLRGNLKKEPMTKSSHARSVSQPAVRNGQQILVVPFNKGNAVSFSLYAI